MHYYFATFDCLPPIYTIYLLVCIRFVWEEKLFPMERREELPLLGSDSLSLSSFGAIADPNFDTFVVLLVERGIVTSLIV